MEKKQERDRTKHLSNWHCRSCCFPLSSYIRQGQHFIALQKKKMLILDECLGFRFLSERILALVVLLPGGRDAQCTFIILPSILRGRRDGSFAPRPPIRSATYSLEFFFLFFFNSSVRHPMLNSTAKNFAKS